VFGDSENAIPLFAISGQSASDSPTSTPTPDVASPSTHSTFIYQFCAITTAVRVYYVYFICAKVGLGSFASFLRVLIPIMKHLYILESKSPLLYRIENSQWLELLHLFTAVTDLYLPREFAPCTAPALRGSVGEGMTAVFLACRGNHQTVYCHASALQSPDSHFLLGGRT